MVLEEIDRQGLPLPTTQFSMRLPDGIDIAIDFAWPDHKVALEVDHPTWHAGAVESHRDKRPRPEADVDRLECFASDRHDITGGLAEAIADVGIVLNGSRSLTDATARARTGTGSADIAPKAVLGRGRGTGIAGIAPKRGWVGWGVPPAGGCGSN